MPLRLRLRLRHISILCTIFIFVRIPLAHTNCSGPPIKFCRWRRSSSSSSSSVIAGVGYLQYATVLLAIQGTALD